MSWFDRAARRRRSRRPAGPDAAVFSRSTARRPIPGLTETMREVEVAPIPDRIGHYLGDDLIARMNGTGETPTAKYGLTIKRQRRRRRRRPSKSQIGIADCGDGRRERLVRL